MRALLARGFLLVASTLLALYAVETYLALARPFDPRSISRRVADLRRRGVQAYPAYIPAFRFRVPSGAMPLSGVRLVRTVMGADDGHTVYDSDEFGFRNPRGLWQPGLQLAVLGDSYVQGYNASEFDDLVSLLRRRYPRTLNLGMTGTGQLGQLAIAREYLPALRPSRVVVVYYEGNDVGDTGNEVLHERVRPYYLDDGYTQELARQVETVDPQLRTILDLGVTRELEREARTAAPPTTLRATMLGIAELTNVRLLWTTQRRWRVRGPIRKPVTYDCKTDFTRLPMKRVVLDEGQHAIRGIDDDPQARGPTMAGFLTDNDLLLGRALYGSDIVLLPRQVFRDILTRMRDAVATWGGRLFFVYLPSHLSVARPACDPNRESVEEIVHATGIPFIDAGEALRGHPDPNRLFVIHLTSDGNRIVADYLLDRLAALDGGAG